MIVIIIMIMMMVVMLIALKCTTRDLLQSPHCAVNCLQHACSNGQGAIV